MYLHTDVYLVLDSNTVMNEMGNKWNTQFDWYILSINFLVENVLLIVQMILL